MQGSLKTFTGIVPISGDHDIDRALVIDAGLAPDNPRGTQERDAGRTCRPGFQGRKDQEAVRDR